MQANPPQIVANVAVPSPTRLIPPLRSSRNRDRRCVQLHALASRGGREEDRRLQKKSKREVRHAKQSSDRSGVASEKRRRGNSRRGRDGRDQQGSDLSGRVRKTRPVERP